MRINGFLAAAAVMTASPAFAGYYEVTLQGHLTAGSNEASPDQRFEVGDLVTLSTRFFEGRYHEDLLPGYWLYGLPSGTNRSEYWRIDTEGLTWISRMDYLDGIPFGTPTINLDNALNVTSMFGQLIGNSGTNVPFLLLNGATFSIQPGNGLYGNTADAGFFLGRWDLEGASVTYHEGYAHVPEPTTWALMLLGFAATGAVVRRRGRHFARA